MTALAPDAVRVPPEFEPLQGAWETTAGRRQARLLVAGRHFTFEFVGGDIYMGTLAVAPGAMDMHIEEGPAEHVGRTARCLVHLADGLLRWCPGRPGSDSRPAAFPDLDDANALCLLFRRDWRATAKR